jgi:hypothetical protein
MSMRLSRCKSPRREKSLEVLVLSRLPCGDLERDLPVIREAFRHC